MATNNICKKCGCQDQALTTPIVYPTPTPCPDPQPCSEAFNSQCVYYTGDDIMCGEDIVVHQDDTIETALAEIVDYFCAAIPAPTTSVLQVNIIKNGGDPTILNSVISDGTAPFTYAWSIAQNVFIGHNITTSTTADSITLSLTSYAIKTYTDDALYQSLIKLEVTDINGNYGSAYYSYETLVIS